MVDPTTLAGELYAATTHTVLQLLPPPSTGPSARSLFDGSNGEEANRLSTTDAYAGDFTDDGIITINMGAGSDAFHFGGFNPEESGSGTQMKIVVNMGDTNTSIAYERENLQTNRDFFQLSGTIEDYVIDLGEADASNSATNVVTFTDKNTGQVVEVHGAEAFVFLNKISKDGVRQDFADDAFTFAELASISGQIVEDAEALAQSEVDEIIAKTVDAMGAAGTAFEDITEEIAMTTLDFADGDGSALADFTFVV